MTFKVDWEKTDTQHQLPDGILEQMVKLAYKDKRLVSQKIISGGCANLNIKIHLEGDERPLIVRIYLRDKDAAYRERKLGNLLKQTVPVPLTYYIGDFSGYRFAVTEFIPGIPLRDLLLGDLVHDVSTVMQDVGGVLAKIAVHEFPKAGFFDKDLNVIESASKDGYIELAKECLQNQFVLSQLGKEVISKIRHYLEKYGHLFSGKNERNLVHADFDPANILVDKIDGVWKVSGVLDWEYSFSGSVLCDVANVLRYMHQMAPVFEISFLEGLASGGVSLPKNWRITINMLNLISLLDCLKRSDSENSPNRCADIRGLIDHILAELHNIKITKHIEVVPYNPGWPKMFEGEEAKIRGALGDNYIAIHHIGSTSVHGIAAKPVIDIIAVIKNTTNIIPQLESVGYQYKGEYNIPMHFGFGKRGGVDVNLHVYEDGHPEIELNLMFRDYLRNHADARDEYVNLKYNLLKDKSSFEKNNSLFTGYNLGKDAFIRNLLQKGGFNRIRFLRCAHYAEWEAAKIFRQKYFFDNAGVSDPYNWTFNHPDHVHLVMYQGAEIIGYAHIQLWSEKRGAMRIIVTIEGKRNQGFGGQFLAMCEKWLKHQGYKSIHVESSTEALAFYKKHGYIEMQFDDPDDYKSDPRDTPIGKIL